MRCRADEQAEPPGAKLIAPPIAILAFAGQAMIEANPFGPLITPENVIFRLWAPGAQRVELLHRRRRTRCARTDDGWFKLTIPGARPGDRYKFRIDGEIEVPDPASRFQPEDVHGPSEVIDHNAYRLADPRLDRPAVARMRVSGIACRHLHDGRHLSRRHRQARRHRRGGHHRHRADAGRRFLRPLELGLRRRAALRARQRLWPARRSEGAGRRRARSAA